MEEWELDFEWLKIRHQIKDLFNRDNLPDFQSILFLLGIQELGKVQDTFSKEEKQDLIHIAVCKLMSFDGFYSFVGLDDQGWPHWKQEKLFNKKGVEHQEQYLKEKIIQYFSNLDEISE
jgi:hypothetical protein